MAPKRASRRTRGHDDQGSALIITLMVMALVTALSTTVAALTIDNLQSSLRAQEAGSALNAADAGVSQAVSYLRSSGVRGLSCSPTCATNAWGNKTAPAAATLPGKAGEGYTAWIEKVREYPTSDPGLYRIHATGTAAGTASRTVSVDITVTSTDVPRGVFARSINGGGSASVSRESVFSTGCVYDRSKIHMVAGELDVAYGIPVGVHSSQLITESNGTGQYCPESDKKLIHKSGSCSTAYPYDQDRLGGTLTSTGCAATQSGYPAYYGPKNLDADSQNDVVGSFIKDDATLFKLFNIKSPALSQAQIDQLRTMAQSQGNYWTQASGWVSPDEANAVMFFDLSKGTNLGGTIDLNQITGFDRATNLDSTSATCASRSLVIVVDGGNVKINSNQRMFASLFLTSSAPYGQVLKANGTADFIGTIYADTVNLVGNVDISLDKCFLANQSPSLLDFHAGSYREEDRGLS
jgi:hypothetical protein